MPTVLLSDDFQQESVSNLLQMLLDLDHGPSEERADVAVATTVQRRRKEYNKLLILEVWKAAMAVAKA